MEIAALGIFIVLIGFYVYFKVKKFQAITSQNQPTEQETKGRDAEE